MPQSSNNDSNNINNNNPVELYTLCTVLAFLLSTFLMHIVEFKHPHFLTATMTAMAIGFLISIGACFTGFNIPFDQNFFFNFMLPPIVFEAGFSMKKKHFTHNFGRILCFAIIGTVVTTIVTGSVLYALTLKGTINVIWSSSSNNSSSSALTFGAILGATDPVSTLACLAQVNIDPNVHALIFGESVLNDAVAIVLFQILSKMTEHHDYNASTIGSAIGRFFLVSFGSLAIGVGFGLLGSAATKLLMKYFYHKEREDANDITISNRHVTGTSIIAGCGFCAFWAADLSGFSGLVALFFAGTTMSHYAIYNLSRFDGLSALHCFQFLAFISESMVFIYIGVQIMPTLDSQCSANPERTFIDWKFPIVTLVLLIVSRFAFVILLSVIVNVASSRKISLRSAVFVSFAGLRGSISFGLSQRYGNMQLIVCTLWMVVVTNVLMGGLSTSMVKVLKLQQQEELRRQIEQQQQQQQQPIQEEEEQAAAQQQERPHQNGFHNMTFLQLAKMHRIHDIWRKIDEKLKIPFGGKKRKDKNVIYYYHNSRESASIERTRSSREV